jgi:hypothetical protein
MPNQQRATIIINRTPELSRQQHDDFLRLHGGKTAFDLMMDDINRRNQAVENLMRPSLSMSNLIHRHRMSLGFHDIFFTKYAPQHVFYLSNKIASSKALKQKSELLAVLVGFLFLNTYQLTPNNGAINRILFSHFSRDNTSQIDSFASITH